MGLHFDFTSEQRMLAASVRGILTREDRTTNDTDEPAIAELGRRLGAHGVFGVMTTVTAGGLGLGLTEALAVSLETGRAQTCFPVIETMVAARLLGESHPAIAGRVLSGEEIATCATSSDAVLDLKGSRPALRGRAIVPFARDARWLALPVQERGSDEPGPGTIVVDLAAPDVKVSRAPEFDLTYPMFHVVLDMPIDPADAVTDGASALLAVLACGELTGAAEYCLELTLRHLKERVQFGKPIGVNQSLRHLAADDWIRIQGMQAAAEYAAACFDALHRAPTGTSFAQADFERAAHVAKAYCSAAAREVAEHSVQMHGGIGFTWDFGLNVPLRRILRLAISHGSVADRHDALADELLKENGRPE